MTLYGAKALPEGGWFSMHQCERIQLATSPGSACRWFSEVIA